MNKIDAILSYFTEMKSLHDFILNDYINKDDYKEELQNSIELFTNIKNDRFKLKGFLHLITKISNNHQRTKDFWAKIETIIIFFKNEIHNYFSDEEIFNIFHSNKRITLFIFKEKIINSNKSFWLTFRKEKYRNYKYDFYLLNEFKEFFITNDKEKMLYSNLQKVQPIFSNDYIFEKTREIGENCINVCLIIRKDSLDEFISYVNKKNISLDSSFQPSVFETNSFLIKNKANLIDYSAFFGSIRIFKYLLKMNVTQSPSLMLYAIHGNNYQIIHILEDNKTDIDDNDYYFNCFIESIKCHHNELAEYFKNKMSQGLNEAAIIKMLKYYNFEYLTDFDNIDQLNLLYYLCRYDHFIPAKLLLNSTNLTKKFLKEKFILTDSVKKRNIDIVKLLMEHHDINVNYKCVVKTNEGDTIQTNALIAAVKNNYLEIAKTLVNHPKTDINNKYVFKEGNIIIGSKIERTPLFYAVMNNNIDIIQFLLQQKKIKINEEININIGDKEETKNVLFEAIERDNLEIVSLLLNHPKIDVNQKLFKKDIMNDDSYSKTALFIAVENNNKALVDLLIANRKININDLSIVYKDQKTAKKTALCMAIENQNIEIIHSLLTNDKKIDLNKKSKWSTITQDNDVLKKRKTPLQQAIEIGNTEIVKILLNEHQEIDINDKCISYLRKRNWKKAFIAFVLLVTFGYLGISSISNGRKIMRALAHFGLGILTIMISNVDFFNMIQNLIVLIKF
ncbi:hypothetical protein M9Y10_020667 [Tritrichomonas musculus]|uniref:DUF3447 domain-containing protein n=1 Tax=Tritrichomonas musculus TaxID=1915356 RepID=A0ABR2HE93_9EUKA